MDEAAQPALVCVLPPTARGGCGERDQSLHGNPAAEHRVVSVPVVNVNWGG